MLQSRPRGLGAQRAQVDAARLGRAMFEELVAEYNGYSGFHNVGYWEAGIGTQREACENLIEKLLAFLPSTAGTILDVGCGKGASTRHLLKYYPADAVTGIDVSVEQLEQCEVNAPDCAFRQMDAVELQFPDASFDNIVCVEAASHFFTRERFFREAVRVLKPGGRLLVSDLLMTLQVEERDRMRHVENYVETLADYRAQLLRAGFGDVELHNTTDQCAGQFYVNLYRFLLHRFRDGRLSQRSFAFIMLSLLERQEATRFYVMASARKPPVATTRATHPAKPKGVSDGQGPDRPS
jgi:ubiquinone/menaquinone biosynthesis C-methylase UbiE